VRTIGTKGDNDNGFAAVPFEKLVGAVEVRLLEKPGVRAERFFAEVAADCVIDRIADNGSNRQQQKQNMNVHGAVGHGGQRTGREQQGIAGQKRGDDQPGFAETRSGTEWRKSSRRTGRPIRPSVGRDAEKTRSSPGENPCWALVELESRADGQWG
jgi:hypothetical protein